MVYVFLADGFETIEALAVVDMLRRAKIDNETVGVTGKTVKSSHNIEVVADITIDELNISNADAIVLPGGMPGTLNLEANGIVQSSIDYCVENKKYVCASEKQLTHRKKYAIVISTDVELWERNTFQSFSN